LCGCFSPTACKNIKPVALPCAYDATMELVLQTFVDRIRAASADATALCIRGGGSKHFYGEPMQGQALDTRAYSGITSYEPSELYVTARAGTPLLELEAALAEKGQCLPFEPPHYSGQATVGGMVAAGLSGPARASVGGVRDYVLGLQLINGKAEHLTFGGQVMKNVAGYDISRLLVGSLGILGLITDVSLKVLPAPPAQATLKFEMSQQQALAQLNLWGGQPLPLNASCWLRDDGVDTLYLRLRGAQAAVQAACKSLGGQRQGDAAAATDWTRLRDQQLPWFSERSNSQNLWRLSVPQTAPALDVPEPVIVEWHGGLRWVRVEAGDTAQAERLRAMTTQAGGHATLFIAASAVSSCGSARFTALPEPLMRIHQQLKKEFDPACIFNPGRLYAGL
jgi:glycolate oxidase FAD binding subunit